MRPDSDNAADQILRTANDQAGEVDRGYRGIGQCLLCAGRDSLVLSGFRTVTILGRNEHRFRLRHRHGLLKFPAEERYKPLVRVDE